MSKDKLATTRELLAGGGHTMQQIADTIGVGRATLYRHLEKHPPTATPDPAAPALAAPATETPPAITSPAPAGGTRAKGALPSVQKARRRLA